jgi:hypothetical protein
VRLIVNHGIFFYHIQSVSTWSILGIAHMRAVKLEVIFKVCLYF